MGSSTVAPRPDDAGDPAAGAPGRRDRQAWVVTTTEAFALVGSGFAGAVAVCLALAAWFYRGFGVAPEEVGIGPTTGGFFFVVILTGVFVGFELLVIEAARARMAMSWVGLVDRGPAFALHRLAVVVFLVAFVPVINRTSGPPVGVGPVGVNPTLVVLAAFAAAGLVLVALNKLVGGPRRTGPSEERVQRVRLTILVGALVTFTLLQLALLIALARFDETAAKTGRDGSGFLYRAAPAEVSALAADSAPELELTLSHCLVYLGQADGVTVVYDVDARATVRMPTDGLLIVAPLDGIALKGSPCA